MKCFVASLFVLVFGLLLWESGGLGILAGRGILAFAVYAAMRFVCDQKIASETQVRGDRAACLHETIRTYLKADRVKNPAAGRAVREWFDGELPTDRELQQMVCDCEREGLAAANIRYRYGWLAEAASRLFGWGVFFEPHLAWVPGILVLYPVVRGVCRAWSLNIGPAHWVTWLVLAATRLMGMPLIPWAAGVGLYGAAWYAAERQRLKSWATWAARLAATWYVAARRRCA